MLFSSVTFLFYFLPLVLIVYYAVTWGFGSSVSSELRTRTANVVLIVASIIFYAWSEGLRTYVMFLVIAVSFACAVLAVPQSPRPPHDGSPTRGRSSFFYIASGVVFCLAVLVTCKYSSFIMQQLAYLLPSISPARYRSEQTAEDTYLVLGISFFTFQAMSYLFDVYSGRARRASKFVNYACYVCMFPQLVAGPIVRYHDIALQLENRRVDLTGIAAGIRRLIFGLAKKLLIADRVAITADAIFSLPDDRMYAELAWLGALCYTLQIYFDFSGYSDIAIGIGKMLGFTFPENFRYPYLASSIKDFWRRWHISLSSWFRDYLYIPLGGNRGSSARTFANLLLVFFLCGLWHGASWTFVAWGLYHGGFLIIERFGVESLLNRLWRPIRHVYALVVVMFGWVLFRAETFDHAGSYLKCMVGLAQGSRSYEPLGKFVSLQTMIVLAIGLLASVPLVAAVDRGCQARLKANNNDALTAGYGVFRGLSGVIWLGLLMLLIATQLAAGSYAPFIYFRF